MVIKRQRVNAGALVEVEADSTDIVDTNGFSDPISTVGAKTAKFSGGGIMQANSGLRIGITQLKINTGTADFIPRSKSIESESGVSNSASMIDNNVNTRGFINDIGQFVIVDFTSIATATLRVIMELNNALEPQTVRVAVSNDNISFSDIATISLVTTKTDYNLGVQTWRYVRILSISGGNQAEIFRIYETLDVSSANVTVKVRSSVSLDTADGTILITDQIMNENETLTFDTNLLLTSNPNGTFVTVEIVSQIGGEISVTLDEITSIQEI